MKIGLLLPHSNQYKTIDRDFVRGLKLNQLDVKFYVESIGIGADEALIIDKMQKMYIQEDIQIIIGFFGHHKINTVYQYATDNNILLLASDLGATLPYKTDHFKGIYINSFGLVESAYLLGNHLNEQGIQNITISSSYYDSGYGMMQALEDSFQNSGCKFSGHYITPFIAREEEAQIMCETIASFPTDVVYASHSGLFAQEHSSFILQTPLLETYPYYTTSFTITKDIIKADSLQNIRVVGSWIENGVDQDDSFTQLYHKTYDSSPNVFALLGYENGLIIKKLLEYGKQSIGDLQQIMSQLEVQGPRGSIHFKNTNRTFFNHYVYKATENNKNEELSFEIIHSLKNNGDYIKGVSQIKPLDKIGGWQNAYLCH